MRRVDAAMNREPKEALMFKHLIFGAAMSALVISPALAQQSNEPAGSTTSPPAASSETQSAGAANANKAAVVTTQKPDQWLASKFKGTTVVGADDKTVGKVSDILFDKTGKVEAYIVSTGGFLGMGAKEVGLPPSAFDVVQGQNGAADKLKIAMKPDELKQAENFKAYEPPRATTTGAAPGGMGAPLGGSSTNR
jgi:sporulation protein YlmC with PRC-barrel domain